MNKEPYEQEVSNGEMKLRQLDSRDKRMRLFEVIVLITVVGLTLFSLIRLSKISEDSRTTITEHSKEISTVADTNKARLDITICIISVSPDVRTATYVKNCYDQIEKQYNLKVQRFGDGANQ